MLQSLILDALIVLILLLLAALGAYRGGLREMCTAAGLLLGVAIVPEWATTWGNWVADKGDINHDAAHFMVAVGTLVAATMICGYGAGAAFAYRPGPGGRMYGAILGLMVGVVFIGYVVNY
ncbi:MAG TPA: CvpA family protein, partial [Thermomicrobiales bacterium]|nr:CvpA family protein [Thermomicrobiales bacterium]